MSVNTQVNIKPLGYVGWIIELDEPRFTVRLLSGTLVVCTKSMLEAV